MLLTQANTLAQSGQLTEALAVYDQYLALEPNNAAAWNNRGHVLDDLGRKDEAIAHWNQSLCRLLMGDYAQGWRQYEWRWRAPAPAGQLLETPQPTWLGEDSIAGKRLILWPEGGDGDVFQFVRFASAVQQMGAYVLLAVRPSSLRLFQHNFPQFELLAMTEGAFIPAADAQCSLMSLPLACGVDSLQKIPQSAAYLSAPPELQALWHKRLQHSQELRAPSPRKWIGLVWAGNSITDVNHDRSLRLSQFEALGQLAQEQNIRFVSLQKGAPSQQALDLAADATSQLHLLDLTNDLHDWADTAALIANLDLVICCDTGVAHLAAAMGKPTWILNRHNGCWRWLTDRADSPWYPSVRLFRQPTFGDWASVIEAVNQALQTQFLNE